MNAAMFLGLKHDKLVLTLTEACSELGMTVGTAHNKIGNGTFPVASRVQGKHRVVDVRDLGAYLDQQRELSKKTLAA